MASSQFRSRVSCFGLKLRPCTKKKRCFAISVTPSVEESPLESPFVPDTHGVILSHGALTSSDNAFSTASSTNSRWPSNW